MDENQLELSSTVFVQVEPPVTADVVVPPDLEKVDRKKPVGRAGPENIQVVEERLEPADKTCHRCGQDRCLIREEASERLDLISAQLIRRRTLRPVYGGNCCKDQSPVQAPMPPQVIEKGLCGPGPFDSRGSRKRPRAPSAVSSAARMSAQRRGNHSHNFG